MFVFLGNHTYIGEISLRWIFNMTHGVSIVPANEFEVITEFLKTQVLYTNLTKGAGYV